MLRISLFRKLSKADKKQTNPQWTRISGVKRYVCLSVGERERDLFIRGHFVKNKFLNSICFNPTKGFSV